MKRWFPLTTQFTADARIEQLGETFGAGGPLAIVVMLGQAKIQNDGGRSEGTFRDLAHDAFLEDRKQARTIVEQAEGVGLIDVEAIDDHGFVVMFPRWRRYQERMRKQEERESTQPSGSVRSRPDPSGSGRKRPETSPTVTVTETGTETKNNVVEPDDAPLSNLLASLIVENGSKPPTVGKAWATAERLLLERDERDPAEAERLIRWCQADEFWRGNVLSMPTFRRQYDTLRLQAQRNGPTPANIGATRTRGPATPKEIEAMKAWSQREKDRMRDIEERGRREVGEAA